MAFCPQTPSRSRVLSAASSLLLCEDGSIPRLYRHLHLADVVALSGVYDLHGRGFRPAAVLCGCGGCGYLSCSPSFVQTGRLIDLSGLAGLPDLAKP